MTLPISNTVEVLPANKLPHGFDYAVPADWALAPGDYVRIPFGARELVGVVWGDGDASRVKKALKPVSAHYSHIPPMSASLREFVGFVARYTYSDIGAVLKMCIPIPDAVEVPNARERAPVPHTVEPAKMAALSGDQAEAAERLAATLKTGFSVTVLDGITGSGKTEVYFDAIEKAIAHEAGQVLVLLPEISLSVQWLERFASRFGYAPHVWHSGLTPAARKHAWRAIVQGQAKVVVGARSALFLPFRHLRLIVVDEEHDGSYKQEEGVLYHARDMAVARARYAQIPVALVSATPSLETYYNTLNGKYRAVHLHARHFGAQLPDISMIDMRSAHTERGAFISQPLREALAETLGRGQQSMLFLNRRGYAPLTLCRHCGHRFQCPKCTAWLVMHKRKNIDGTYLACHHCDYRLPMPKACPSCATEDQFAACGPGVERVAEELATFLPTARHITLASDAADSFAVLQERIQAMQLGEVDILIGTQMIAKGYHFGNLALVGVVDADLGLEGGDLRAGERTYQLLHQLSGRAGREQVAGRVLMQSYAPTHPIFTALVKGDRDAFLQLELDARKRGRLPPFSRLVALIIEGEREEQVSQYARQLARSAPPADLDILGPAPAPLYRLRGRFRQRLLMRAPRETGVQGYVHAWLAACKPPSSVRVKIDIDPQGFM